ncbi:MAG: Txe/YoeB family addiction module toxin [Bacteroidales bacterium]|jgi:toxin YoeB|nr:Txe/YoeB family addiction module toxin [Bacteroidales bacterium]
MAYIIELSKRAEKDKRIWEKSGNVQIKNEINRLLTEIIEHPKIGSGDPKELTGEFAGCWSRKISKKDRMIYQIFPNYIYIIALRKHYKDH